MSQTTTLARIQEEKAPVVNVGFDTLKGFEAIQRMANLFSASSIVPEVYRSKGEKDYTSRGNCVIALDMALRMGANPLMVMQNLYVVHGRPAWSAQFLIATLNQSGKFSALRYEFQGKEGQDDWGCRAVATELATKERLVGPLITISLAKKEGWYSKKDKNGKESSKWQSMPELMLRYRAAAWFVRAYAPEIAMGLQTVEEVHDSTYTFEPDDSGIYQMTTAEIRKPEINPETGEVYEESERTPEPRAEDTRSAAPKTTPAPGKKGGTANAAEKTEAAPKQITRAPQDPPLTHDPVTGEVFGKAANLVTCPKNGKRVEEWECLGKACHKGCPEFD